MTTMLRFGPFILALAALTGCSKENEADTSTHVQSGVGAQCTGVDDPACGVLAVCVLGYCRVGCSTDAQCPQGTLCVGDTAPFGCLFPEDVNCNQTDRKCAAPLVCALDGACRISCDSARPCPRQDQSCHAGVCVGDAEKSDAARAYRSCTDGARQCGTDGLLCFKSECAVYVCNTLEPGWTLAETCTGDSAVCGDGQCLPNVAPLVQVTSPLGGTYGIDATEVTRLQYARFVVAKGSDMSGQPDRCFDNTQYAPAYFPFADRPNEPVQYVDWCDAYMYCKWVGKRLCGKIGGGSNDAADFADPTKSQWFNACSSGGKNAYPYGNTYDGQACNTLDRGLEGALPVGSSPACTSTVAGYAGVYDLSGNVREWEDSCDDTMGPSAMGCRVRGGAHGFDKEHVHCAADDRSDLPGTPGTYTWGIRCCSDP